MAKFYFEEVTESYYKITNKSFSRNSEINVTPELYEEFLLASLKFSTVQQKIIKALIEQQKQREA